MALRAMSKRSRTVLAAVGAAAPMLSTCGHAEDVSGGGSSDLSAPNAKAGQTMMATQIDDLEGHAAQFSAIPYPTAIKDLTPEDYPAEVADWLPVGANAEAAIPEDEDYYTDAIGGLVEEFNGLVSQK